MVDRRKADRRDSERREFRAQEGRRDAGSIPRRLGARRYVLPALIVTLAVVLLLAYRIGVVAPRAEALLLAAETQSQLEPLLRAARLPMLAFPGMADPGPGPLSVDQPLLRPEQRSLVQGLVDRIEQNSSVSTVAMVELYSLKARARLLLGDERDARMAYELVLARGSAEQKQDARLALGVLALRTSLRQVSAQDRGFAFEHALSYFDRVVDKADNLMLSDGLFNKVVTLVLLGRMEAANAVLSSLTDLSGGSERQVLLRMWMVTGGSVSLLMPSEGLPTIGEQGVP